MTRGRAPEQTANVAVAARAGYKDSVTYAGFHAGTACSDAAYRFVPGNERITHAGKWRHLACPKELFGAGADAGELDVDQYFPRSG